MSILFLLISLLFFVWNARNILFWVSLWQLKEYRFDRVRIHLTETLQGRNLLLSSLSTIKWLAILAYGFVIFNDIYFDLFHVVIGAIYVVQGITVFKEIYFRLIKRPTFTVKAGIIAGLTFLIVGTLYFFPMVDRFVWLLLLDRIVVLLISLFVLAFSVPTEFYRDIKVEKAIKKLADIQASRKENPILVIGITGSYGKSSTKDYVAQLLEKKFRVVKTQGTNNTPIGIANTILGSLKKTTQIFVVEMGAYKIGEIAEMCQMVHPTIGILTAVNEQHVSLFGSIENTKKAKYEIIDAVPKKGLALFNGNNDNAAELFIPTKKKKVLYKVIENVKEKNKLQDDSTVYASNVVVDKKSISFNVTINNNTMHLKTPLVGGHNIENILPAIYIAHYLGMKEPEIKKAVATLSPLPKTMGYYEVNGFNIIDDTFNANPEAVMAVLSYMKIYKKKKILVMQPMIELGKKADEEHYRVAKEIGKVCDYLFVTNKNFYDAIVKGVSESKGNCEVEIGDASSISAYINRVAEKGDVIVCEGKEAGFVLDRLL